MRLGIFCALLAFFVAPLHAQERVLLGYGALITNDFLGDGGDRWQTGSVQGSRVWGPAAGVTDQLFDVLELRIGGRVINPANLRTPSPGDRRYASALSFGLHTHYARGATNFAFGGDLVVIGPQTRLDHLQAVFHDAMSASVPSVSVLRNQIPDQIRPAVVLEAGQRMTLGSTVDLRPFAEGRAGVENTVRVGFDLTFGKLGNHALATRDEVTGQRYGTVHGKGTGIRWTLGSDIAYVGRSAFLPEDGSGPAPSDVRTRVRAGAQWQAKNGARGFYGLTWLGEEFEGQDGGQVVGSFNVKLRF